MSNPPHTPAGIPLVRFTTVVMTACKVAALAVAGVTVLLHIATWGEDLWSATVGAGCVAAAAWIGIAMLRRAKHGPLHDLPRFIVSAALARVMASIVFAVAAMLLHPLVFGDRLIPWPFWTAFICAGGAVVAIEVAWVSYAIRRAKRP